uniref:BHLH domain-containing protein n=1 Tax=Globodera pallida TaxID=36090 RepID=A0A183BNX1_GLOPA
MQSPARLAATLHDRLAASGSRKSSFTGRRHPNIRRSMDINHNDDDDDNNVDEAAVPEHDHFDGPKTPEGKRSRMRKLSDGVMNMLRQSKAQI